MPTSSDDHAPQVHAPKSPAPVPERYRVSAADFLAQDTWADDPETCPECGSEVAAGDARCRECGQWLERCSGSCPSCASPRCVGGKRKA